MKAYESIQKRIKMYESIQKRMKAHKNTKKRIKAKQKAHGSIYKLPSKVHPILSCTSIYAN